MAGNIKTYVLVGSGNELNGLTVYKYRSDIILLQPKSGESIAQVAAKIHGPANIILQVHGGVDGGFRWHQGEYFPYSQLFSALPKNGILSITLGSCYGGMALKDDMMKAAPPGTLVQSMTGPETPNPSFTSIKFAQKTKGLTRPIDLFLEALDNFHPKKYHDFYTYVNQHTGEHNITDPEAAMPHILGIAGNPPQHIDLAEAMTHLRGHGAEPAFQRAIQRVQGRFNTNMFHAYANNPGLNGPDGSLGPTAEQQLHQNIASVAHKLAHGIMPKNIEEKRLAYAITAAYLDESGELQRKIDKQIPIDSHAKLDANGMIIDPHAALPLNTHSPLAKAWEQTQHWYNYEIKGITVQEQTYINSVAEKLKDNPSMRAQIGPIMTGLVHAFSQTKGNDFFAANSDLATKLHQAGINTRSWERPTSKKCMHT